MTPSGRSSRKRDAPRSLPPLNGCERLLAEPRQMDQNATRKAGPRRRFLAQQPVVTVITVLAPFRAAVSGPPPHRPETRMRTARKGRTLPETPPADLRTMSAGGGTGRVAAGRRATTRCRITTDRSGRTITPWPRRDLRYGLTGEALRIFRAMFDLSQAVEVQRLPELICGFHRRTGDAPTLYPVACAPHAWACRSTPSSAACSWRMPRSLKKSTGCRCTTSQPGVMKLTS
jgi:hypothetical protein